MQLHQVCESGIWETKIPEEKNWENIKVRCTTSFEINYDHRQFRASETHKSILHPSFLNSQLSKSNMQAQFGLQNLVKGMWARKKREEKGLGRKYPNHSISTTIKSWAPFPKILTEAQTYICLCNLDFKSEERDVGMWEKETTKEKGLRWQNVNQRCTTSTTIKAWASCSGKCDSKIRTSKSWKFPKVH